MVGAFVAGSVGVFLAFNWPPLLREIVLGYLSVAIVTWAALTVTRVFLLPPSLGVPQSQRNARLPDERRARRPLAPWIAINVFWLMFVVVTFALMGTFGFDRVSRTACCPIPTSFDPARAHPAGGVAAAEAAVTNRCSKAERHRRALGWSWLLSLYFTLVWIIQIAGAWRLYLVCDRRRGIAGGDRARAQRRALRAATART